MSEVAPWVAARFANQDLEPLTLGMTVLDASMYRLDRERRMYEMQQGFMAGAVMGALHRHANRQR